MRSLTAQGSAYTRFRRALDRGKITEALSSAAELEHVGLAEALELCLLLADKAPQRFGQAAVRWHGRFCREAQVDPEEAQAVLAALALLAGRAEAECRLRVGGASQPARAGASLRRLVAWAREA